METSAATKSSPVDENRCTPLIKSQATEIDTARKRRLKIHKLGSLKTACREKQDEIRHLKAELATHSDTTNDHVQLFEQMKETMATFERSKSI
jgi:hypothetical protein